MARGQGSLILRYVHGLVGRSVAGARSDRQLLESFAGLGDEAAFAALVERHGALVWGVCRRVLGHDQDAEDAFQATFLVLARKAGSVRWRREIANWLYAVAVRVAQRARSRAQKQRCLESEAVAVAKANEVPDSGSFELIEMVDEEVSRLPEKYRQPVVLCCLEGKTYAEASRLLGWPEGTTSARLSRARALLRRRLTRRGLALSGAAAAILTGPGSAGAAVPAGLAETTARAAPLFAAHQVIAGPAVTLAEGMLEAMFLTRLKITVVVLLTLGVLGAGLGLRAQSGDSQAADPTAIGSQDEKPDKAPAKDKKAEDESNTKPKRPERADIVQPAMMPLAHGKGAVTAVAFSPDGKTVATACANKTVRLWDLSTGRQSKKMTYEPPYFNNGRIDPTPTGVAFTADGKGLVCLCAEGMIYSWDTNTGRLVWKSNDGGSSQGRKNMMAVFPDGSRLVTGFSFNSSRGPASSRYVFDMRTGKQIMGFSGGGASPFGHTIRGLAVSPDGKLIASAGKEGVIYLWDIATAKEHRRLKGAACNGVVFAPKGDAVAVAEDEGLRVFDIETGKERFHRDSKEVVRAVAYSPDGKTLATVGDDRVVRLWDAATGKEQRQFGDVQGKLTAVAFSPKGKRIVTVGADGTALVWDLTKEQKPLPRDLKLTEKELIGLYADLTSDDGIKFYAAARMLRADPARSLPFLKERLKPRAPTADETRIKKLIADLDADTFKTREAASKALQELGKNAEPMLRQALANPPSAEAQTRLKKLLALLGENAALTAEQQRDVRVVHFIEQTGTPEAKKLLEALIKESHGWWVTQEAREALERLAHKKDK
jgi:RNA polymerase sigma factor (sigma-70 family)